MTDSREAVAGRLLRTGVRNTFDPEVEVDWSAPLDPGRPFLPWRRMSLYGTDLWDTLTQEQRIELSRHEMTSILGVGLWFEIILMRMFARYVYDRDPRTAHVQFALTELGDETRHVVMFARAATKFGAPRYTVPRLVHQIGRMYGATAFGPSMFAGILVAEEITDRLQRAIMVDEEVQPLTRTINRIHVIEEARHVRYAKEELRRLTPGLNRAALEWHRLYTAAAAAIVVENLVDPRVYRSVGISPRAGRAAAKANPHHLETRRWLAEKLVPFLAEVRLFGGPSTRVWRRAHLI